MRKSGLDIGQVKAKILSLKGREVEMNINKGRKKYDSLCGVIQDVYPSVFTVVEKENSIIKTFSYYDVLCGNVKFLES